MIIWPKWKNIFAGSTDEYPKLLAEKASQYVKRFHLLTGKEINNFNETGVILTGDLQIDNIDAVICCTGNKLSYKFVEKEVKTILEYEDRYSRTLPKILYIGTVRPELPNLAFIENPMTITGYYRELQVRYACYLFSGRMTHRISMIHWYQSISTTSEKCVHFQESISWALVTQLQKRSERCRTSSACRQRTRRSTHFW